LNRSTKPKADVRYFGVRCQRCGSPILFAIDRRDGKDGSPYKPVDKLVLTCHQATCKHQGNYTASVVSGYTLSADPDSKPRKEP